MGKTSQLGMSLILSQFRKNLCAASFWSLLLRDSIVGACKACGDAVFARPGAFSNAFDFSAVAAVVGYVSSALSGSTAAWWGSTNLSQARLTGVEVVEEVDMVESSSGGGLHVPQPAASGLDEDSQIVIESWACCAMGRETFLQVLAWLMVLERAPTRNWLTWTTVEAWPHSRFRPVLAWRWVCQGEPGCGRRPIAVRGGNPSARLVLQLHERCVGEVLEVGPNGRQRRSWSC
jgi:hypothetical protein